MATIGCGGQGTGDMHGFINYGEVQMAAVCDPVKAHRERAQTQVNDRYKNKDCSIYSDFREVLDRNDIDAVLIGTPDHWHSTITVAAARAGKDVYCEKPESLTIREGRKMANAIKKYGIVFSGGSQRVIGDYGDLPRLLWGGAIGEIKEVFVDCGGPSGDCYLPAEQPPEGLDWDLWIGPAPWRPFHNSLIRGGFRSYRDYSGGGMTDWGAHRFGAALFATQQFLTGPVEILPGIPGDDKRRLQYLFANGMKMYHAGVGDIVYEGTEGSLRMERNQLVGKHHKPATRVEIPGYKWFKTWEAHEKSHHRIFGDFIYCVKTRQQPFRNIEAAHRALTVCHLGNLVYWLGRPIKWDPVKEEIIGDPEAARWLDRPKRAPWNDEI
jgi:predicted dehydrogenase